MRKALVRLEQLQAENTRLEKERDDYKRLMFESDERSERRLKQLQDAEALNTPLKDALRSAAEALQAVRGYFWDAEPAPRRVKESEVDDLVDAALKEARSLLEKPSGTVPAVTGTTSDKNPIRKPAAGDAKGTRNG